MNGFSFQVLFLLKRLLAHEGMNHVFLFPSTHPGIWHIAHIQYIFAGLSLHSTFKVKVTCENRGMCECAYVCVCVCLLKTKCNLMTFYNHTGG